jgi:hypothetical protein
MSRRDALFNYLMKVQSPPDRILVPVLGGDGYVSGSVYLTLGPVADQAALINQARTRLTDAGWTTAIVDPPGEGRALGATKGQLAMQWDTATDLREPGVKTDNAATVLVAVYRREPDQVRPGVLLGGLAGALLGWLGAVGVSRRSSGNARLPRRPCVLAASLTGLALLLPTTALTLLFNAGYAFYDQAPIFALEAPWAAYMWPLIRTAAIAGTGAVVLASVVALGPQNHRD